MKNIKVLPCVTIRVLYFKNVFLKNKGEVYSLQIGFKYLIISVLLF